MVDRASNPTPTLNPEARSARPTSISVGGDADDVGASLVRFKSQGATGRGRQGGAFLKACAAAPAPCAAAFQPCARHPSCREQGSFQYRRQNRAVDLFGSEAEFLIEHPACSNSARPRWTLMKGRCAAGKFPACP